MAIADKWKIDFANLGYDLSSGVVHALSENYES